MTETRERAFANGFTSTSLTAFTRGDSIVKSAIPCNVIRLDAVSLLEVRNERYASYASDLYFRALEPCVLIRIRFF